MGKWPFMGVLRMATEDAAFCQALMKIIIIIMKQEGNWFPWRAQLSWKQQGPINSPVSEAGGAGWEGQSWCERALKRPAVTVPGGQGLGYHGQAWVLSLPAAWLLSCASIPNFFPAPLQPLPGAPADAAVCPPCPPPGPHVATARARILSPLLPSTLVPCPCPWAAMVIPMLFCPSKEFNFTKCRHWPFINGMLFSQVKQNVSGWKEIRAPPMAQAPEQSFRT